jgi:pimeloyl-ACP methyl ester carboxylesterase
MSYITAGFALQGLRVFVPDLPGHGRTDGPFSYQRSEQCSQNLLGELTARGLLDPERTILAGHSLGGAIALRVASHRPVAGVIAIAPAPMRPVPGVSPEMLPFPEFGALPAHSLVLSASSEPDGIRYATKELVPVGEGTSEYVVIPRSTHVGILFSEEAMATAQNWAARVLRLESQATLPGRRGVLGFFAGFAGILLLAGPFLRETLQSKKQTPVPVENAATVPKGQAFLEIAVVALGTVGLLSYGNPLRVLHLFEGDYLTSFLLVLGVVLLALHWKSLRNLFAARPSDSQPGRPFYLTLLAATAAALLLYLLAAAWIDLSISEAWLTTSRWVRFTPMLVAMLPYHAVEELLLGPATAANGFPRLLKVLSFRLVAWGALVTGVFFLHSGEVLLVLLAPSFAMFCVLQSWGMKVVREVTASAAAAALFGAILLTGFCLVVFPTT